MPELNDHHDSFQVLPLAFQSQAQSQAQTRESISSSLTYPSSFLQAGAVLAVQLATRTREDHEHDHDQGQNQNQPQNELDDNLSVNTADWEESGASVAPHPNNYPALSGGPGTLHLNPTGPGTDPDSESVLGMDNLHTNPGGPPRKRRRFDGNLPNHQLDINSPSQSLVNIYEQTRVDDKRLPPPANTTIVLPSASNVPQPAPVSPPELATSEPEPDSTPQSSSPARTPFSFFHFPGEIRNAIYDYSLQWPTSKQLYHSYNRRIDQYYLERDANPGEPSAPFPEYSPRFRAPTILLLCRAITAECLPLLQSRTLVIDALPPWRPGEPRPMPMTDFITKDTFQAVRSLELRIPLGLGSLGSGWVWSDVACDLLAMLLKKNKFEHLLVAIIIHYEPRVGSWDVAEQMSLEEIDAALVKLEIENPNIRTPCILEREYWIVGDRRATRARTNSKGELHASEEEPHEYPDGGFWSGSVLEFV